MREIKFRVWDIKDNLWLAGWNIGQSGITSEYGNKVVMQYTGLKDKNGKEIYEGDITNKGEVKWNDEFSGFSPFCEQTGCLPDSYSEDNIDMETLEVIGNIYENPELLK